MQEEFEGPTDAQPITSSIGTSLFEGPQRTEEDKDEGSSVEETPLLGAEIPQEAFDKAVGVVRRFWGMSQRNQSRWAQFSRVSLNTAPGAPISDLPVDVECIIRFNRIAMKEMWSEGSLPCGGSEVEGNHYGPRHSRDCTV